MDGGEEVARGLVVPRGDAAELLELGEEVLDQEPRLAEVAVVVPLLPPALARRNDGGLAGRGQGLQHARIGVEGAVGDERLGLHVGQQRVGAGEVVRLAAGQGEAEGIAERVHEGVDLGAQPALAAADGLRAAPFSRARAVPVGAHDGAVEHRVSGVRVGREALEHEVLAEQFAWSIRYPGADGEIGKRNYKLTSPTNPYGIDFNDKASWDDLQTQDIVIPVNKSVRFHILSKDIIHSFYIPDFRVQINAVPGMTNYFQFTPTVTTEEMRDKMNDPNYNFIMLCNKICGQGHFNMGKKVIVVSEAEYKEWLATQNKYFTEDLQKEFASNNEVEAVKTASIN